MRGLLLFMIIAPAALPQTDPGLRDAKPLITVSEGVSLRVALERKVRIRNIGQPIRARLVEPIYVFDRLAVPSGTVVEGHVADIGGVPFGRRLAAILSGNLTPPREVRAQFDALVLSDESRLSVSTFPSRGMAHTARATQPPKTARKRKSAGQAPGDKGEGTSPAAHLAYRTPGIRSRLGSRLFAMFPYHRQAWSAGTLFSGVLQQALLVPSPGQADATIDALADANPDAQLVRARLLSPISSATASKGARVEAVVTRPLFSGDRSLLIPEGSRLVGEVVEARRARFLHRNGKLLFVFRQITPARGEAQSIQGYLEEVDADFDTHLALDSEGAARVSSPMTRFIFPVIAAAVAGLSLHQDYNSQGIPDQDIGGRAESGVVGFGLIGTLLAQASRPLASGIAFSGAGFAVYSTFIGRGSDVALPANTPLEVGLKARGGEAGTGKPLKRGVRECAVRDKS